MNRVIRFRIIDNCNFNCSYCIEHSDGKQSTKKDLDNLFKNLEKLYKIEQRKIDFFIYGGEPILYKHLDYFIEKVSKYNFTELIEIHTNLSKDIDIELIKNHNILICSSLHFEYRKNFSKQIENFIKLKEIGKLKEINIMLRDLTELKEVFQIKNKLKELKLSCSIIPIFELLDKYGYNKLSVLIPELKIKDTDIYKMGKVNYTKIQAEYNPYGIYCNCPKDSFIVNYNGDVLICQEDLRINKITKYNMFEKNKTIPEFFINPTICKHKRCRCEYDIKKWKN